jgi:hypothetical protein
MIRLVCPQCGVSLNAPESRAGKRAKCPQCRQKIPVPLAFQAPAVRQAGWIAEGEPPMEPPSVAPGAPGFATSTLASAAASAVAPPRKALPWGAIGVAVLFCLVVALVATAVALRRPSSSAQATFKFARHDMALKTFLETAPRDPKTFRLICQLGDYYNYDFTDARASHHSIRMLEPGTSDFITGYVAKTSTLGRQILDDLKDGKMHWHTVEVQHVGKSSSCVAVLRFDP